MRPDPFDQQPEWGRLRYNHAPAEPHAPARPQADRAPFAGFEDWHGGDSSGGGLPPIEAPRPRRRWGRWIMRGFGAAIILFVVIVA